MNLKETIKSAGLLVAVLVASRLIGLPANVTPLLGLAVFAHRMNLSPWVTVGILAVTDVFFLGLYALMPVVYACMFSAYFIGKYMNNVYASGAVSVLVWHVTVNGAVWLSSGGPLLQTYIDAIPFDFRLLVSTLAFTALLDVTQRLTHIGRLDNKQVL
jgi:hypothetical protein